MANNSFTTSLAQNLFYKCCKFLTSALVIKFSAYSFVTLCFWTCLVVRWRCKVSSPTWLIKQASSIVFPFSTSCFARLTRWSCSVCGRTPCSSCHFLPLPRPSLQVSFPSVNDQQTRVIKLKWFTKIQHVFHLGSELYCLPKSSIVNRNGRFIKYLSTQLKLSCYCIAGLQVRCWIKCVPHTCWFIVSVLVHVWKEYGEQGFFLRAVTWVRWL